MKLATIASVATLILFVFYIVGRIITIMVTDHIWKDKIVTLKDTQESPYDIVDEIYENYPPFETSYGINQYSLLVSKEGIRNLKVFQAEMADNSLGAKRGKQIFHRVFLNIDQAIAIYVPLGEVVPYLFIEYTTYDYMRVQIAWIDNLKNGIFTEHIQPKHTIRSVIYQFLK